MDTSIIDTSTTYRQVELVFRPTDDDFPQQPFFSYVLDRCLNEWLDPDEGEDWILVQPVGYGTSDPEVRVKVFIDGQDGWSADEELEGRLNKVLRDIRWALPY